MSQAIGATAAARGRAWREVDMADGRFLGRICADIARILVGRHKPVSDPAIDSGDFVVVINAAKMNVPKYAEFDRVYCKNFHRPNGFVQKKMSEYMREDKFHYIMERTVYNMLPRNKTRKERIKRMFVYNGTEHPFKDNIIRSYINPRLYPNFHTGRLLSEPTPLLLIPAHGLDFVSN